MCECNCHDEHDNYITKEEMEDIMTRHREHRIKALLFATSTPYFLKHLDKQIAKSFDHRTSMKPDAR